MSVIDQAYFTKAVGTNTVIGLFNDGSGGVDTSVLAQFLAETDSAVYAALRRAGYESIASATTIPASGTDARTTLQRAAVRHLYQRAALLRRQTTFTDADLLVLGDSLEDIATGKIPIPGYTPAQDGAVGGLVIADSGTQADTSSTDSGTRGLTFKLPNTAGLF